MTVVPIHSVRMLSVNVMIAMQTVMHMQVVKQRFVIIIPDAVPVTMSVRRTTIAVINNVSNRCL